MNETLTLIRYRISSKKYYKFSSQRKYHNKYWVYWTFTLQPPIWVIFGSANSPFNFTFCSQQNSGIDGLILLLPFFFDFFSLSKEWWIFITAFRILTAGIKLCFLYLLKTDSFYMDSLTNSLGCTPFFLIFPISNLWLGW